MFLITNRVALIYHPCFHPSSTVIFILYCLYIVPFVHVFPHFLYINNNFYFGFINYDEIFTFFSNIVFTCIWNMRIFPEIFVFVISFNRSTEKWDWNAKVDTSSATIKKYARKNHSGFMTIRSGIFGMETCS